MIDDIMKAYPGTATLDSPGPAGDQARLYYSHKLRERQDKSIEARLNEVDRKLDLIAAALKEHLEREHL